MWGFVASSLSYGGAFVTSSSTISISVAFNHDKDEVRMADQIDDATREVCILEGSAADISPYLLQLSHVPHHSIHKRYNTTSTSILSTQKSKLISLVRNNRNSSLPSGILSARSQMRRPSASMQALHPSSLEP